MAASRRILFSVTLCILFASVAPADVIFNLSQTINGATPSGSAPWAIATIQNDGANQVKLTLTNAMSSTEFIHTWLFNTSTVLTAAPVYIGGSSTGPTYTNFASFATQSDNGSPNIKAGLFNLDFTFQKNNSSTPLRFYGGETSVFTISQAGITEDWFKVKSLPDGIHIPGGYYTAADVQGIPGGLSGSIGATTYIPEPGSIGCVAGLLIGTMFWIRRRRA